MRFTSAVVLSLVALAAPQLIPINSLIGNIGNDVTVAQASDTCGSDMELSCCNNDSVNTANGLLDDLLEDSEGSEESEESEESEDALENGDSVNSGNTFIDDPLEDVLENAELSLFFGCSKLNVAALIGVDDLLNSQCMQTAACCQNSDVEQNGLLNIGLPCIALGGLL